jgi:hypothetical protein
LQTVDPNGASFAALAFDSSGNPHIAYGNGTIIKYASWAGSSWQIRNVDAVSAFQLSLAFNQRDIPYILYGYSSSDDSNIVRLAIGNNTGWNIQTIALPSPISGFGNMVLDSKGYPHFISAQNNILNYSVVSSLFYLSWNGTGWSTREITSNAMLVIDSPSINWMYVGSVALDSNSNPHVTYTTTAGKVMYASWTNNSWNISSVEGYTSASEPGFLALDSNGSPHISFFGPLVMSYGYANLIRVFDVVHATALLPVVAEPNPTPEPFPVVPVAGVSVAVAVVVAVAAVVYLKKRKRGQPA